MSLILVHYNPQNFILTYPFLIKTHFEILRPKFFTLSKGQLRISDTSGPPSDVSPVLVKQLGLFISWVHAVELFNVDMVLDAKGWYFHFSYQGVLSSSKMKLQLLLKRHIIVTYLDRCLVLIWSQLTQHVKTFKNRLDKFRSYQEILYNDFKAKITTGVWMWRKSRSRVRWRTLTEPVSENNHK